MIRIPSIVGALAALAFVGFAPAATANPVMSAAVRAPHPTIASTIAELLADPVTAAVLEKHLPGISVHPARPQFEAMTLAEAMPGSNGALTPEIIAAIDADLKALPHS